MYRFVRFIELILLGNFTQVSFKRFSFSQCIRVCVYVHLTSIHIIDFGGRFHTAQNYHEMEKMDIPSEIMFLALTKSNETSYTHIISLHI